ncbi:alpha/beta hydrolase [Loigolactobacillus zhaoyuanensis]|uniref:Alpha/beta hydrolase n=1 Tax=Loigolactobacillus zhaoyuanensis TaxID=2486017 RepID=A0ABW8UCJ3_9LACO|nr:alpha/beta hydrolase [Loigolactobacillus zhaoyuanensis]
MNKKKFWLSALILLLTVILGWSGYQWQKRSIDLQQMQFRSPMDPIFLIPGSSANQNRFDSLVTLLNKSSLKRSLLKVTVQTDDSLKFSGHLKPGDKHPLIVVGFENNQDGYANIKRQAKWFSIAYAKLAKTYHFNHFSALGHSNGGLVLTIFAEKYLPKNNTIDRLMAIASPFNLEKETTKRTALLKDLIAHKSSLPKKMRVYSIAGTENYEDDGIVPFISVDSGKYIFQDQVASYTEIIVTGANTNHSDLPENQQIVNIIRQYILQEDISKTIRQQNEPQAQAP